MRVVVQRVTEARVFIDGVVAGSIGQGLAILVGVAGGDTEEDAAWLADKVVNLRLFADETGRMNRSVLEVSGELLVISQFTLYGDCRKGRRPDFSQAAPPDAARKLYNCFIQELRSRTNERVTTGVFRAQMDVALTNHGPVTLICDSIKRVVKKNDWK